MSRKLFLTIASLFLGVGSTFSARAVYALTPLTSAEIREIVRRVQFIPRGQTARDAVLSEVLRPDDALLTAKASRVGLRFNDGSWARVGEMATFRFAPGTRNFRLTNGTVLLLIKPGQGRTTIDTPNASTGVRGSALFVRYDEQTETTVVGALTNNPAGPMEIVDNTTGRRMALEAGQMAIVDPLGIRLFNFDMHRFYETSDMVRGLDLQRREAQPHVEPGIAAVQAETAQALQEQKPLTGTVIENPRMVQLTPVPDPIPATPATSQDAGGTTQQTTQATPATPATPSTTGQPTSGSPSNPSTGTPSNSNPETQGSPTTGQPVGSTTPTNQNSTGSQQSATRETVQSDAPRGGVKAPESSEGGSDGTNKTPSNSTPNNNSSTTPNPSTPTNSTPPSNNATPNPSTPTNSTSAPNTSTPSTSTPPNTVTPSNPPPNNSTPANPEAVGAPAPNSGGGANTPNNPVNTPPVNSPPVNSTPPVNTPPVDSTPPVSNPPNNSEQPRQILEATPPQGAIQPNPEQNSQPAPVETPQPAPEQNSQPAPVETPQPAPVETPQPAPEQSAPPTPVETPQPIPVENPPQPAPEQNSQPAPAQNSVPN